MNLKQLERVLDAADEADRLRRERDLLESGMDCEVEENTRLRARLALAEAEADERVRKQMECREALNDERERLRARVARLEAALRPCVERLKEYIDCEGGCDHSVGICICDVVSAVENATAALAEEES